MSARLAVLAASALAACTSAQVDPQAGTAPDLRESGQQTWAEACADWDEWNKAGPPYRIYGNSYYVGTCGIAAILITGDAGHILIDGGPLNGGPLIEANIEALGFSMQDVKLLLHSHEHHDHVGGLAYLQRVSGAETIASHGAAAAMRSGEPQLGDPQQTSLDPFEPVTVSREVGSYDFVSLGKLSLIPLETPGHTPGALSWQWWSCEGTDCRVIAYVDSLSPISAEDYRFSDHPDYVAQYRSAIETIRTVPCDILMTPHPSASDMRTRMTSQNGLTDASKCVAYAEAMEARLDTRLAEEAAE